MDTINREGMAPEMVGDEKLVLVDAMSTNYKYKDYTSYERFNTMHKDTSKYKCLIGRRKGELVWDSTCQRFNEQVGGTKLLSDQFASWFKLVADAMRILKYQAPEAFVEIAILGLPRIDNASFVSRLVPEGVHILHSEDTGDQNIKQLIRDMKGTK